MDCENRPAICRFRVSYTPVFDRLTATLTRLRTEETSTTQTAATPGDDGDPPAETDPATHLFECESCERVFVATEKQTCADCDAAVEQVA